MSATMTTATALAMEWKCQRRRLPNELLSELVDCLPRAQFIDGGGGGGAPNVPRFGPSQEWAMLRNVALTTYLARVRHKYEKAIKEYKMPLESAELDELLEMCENEEERKEAVAAAVAAVKTKVSGFRMLKDKAAGKESQRKQKKDEAEETGDEHGQSAAKQAKEDTQGTPSSGSLGLPSHDLPQQSLSDQFGAQQSAGIDRTGPVVLGGSDPGLISSPTKLGIGGNVSDSSNEPSSVNTALPVSLALCTVCGDNASIKHYGALSCEGCRAFFRRSVLNGNDYVCQGNNDCPVKKSVRKRCKSCRMRKCLESGMKRERVREVGTSMQKYSVLWQGLMATKNAETHVDMQKLWGNDFLMEQLYKELGTTNEDGVQLIRVDKRMPMEKAQPHLEKLSQWMDDDENSLALICVPCGPDQEELAIQKQKMSMSFIDYFKTKNVAGLVGSSDEGKSHSNIWADVIPPGDFSQNLLSRKAPDFLETKASLYAGGYLVVIVTRK